MPEKHRYEILVYKIYAYIYGGVSFVLVHGEGQGRAGLKEHLKHNGARPTSRVGRRQHERTQTGHKLKLAPAARQSQTKRMLEPCGYDFAWFDKGTEGAGVSQCILKNNGSV